MQFQFPFTSVTRWLLVVVGCAVLATAQPMSAADDTAARTESTVLYPKGTAPEGLTRDTSPGGNSWIIALAFVLALGGAWVLVQRRRGGALGGLDSKKLRVEETRSLGNRQYLVVANYDGQRFLLGVTPGQIQLVSVLHEADPEDTAP